MKNDSNQEWDAQGAVTTQGDKAYKRGFSDGMKEAPTGESWIRAIDEAMVGAHIGVAEMADDYGTAKKKLNALICWSVQVDRDLSRAQAAPVPSDSDDLIKALADVRDLFPIPERGSKLERAWMEAVAFPESVPAYVRACIAPAALPVGELPEPFHPRASHINPDYRDGWNAALAAARSQPVREPLTDYSDTATIAGLESSVGHLSVMVDELRLMLGDAMNAMTELHSKVTPDEDTPNIDGIVPAAAYAKFVNAHADLLYRIHHSPHAGQLSRLPAAHGITKKGEQ